MDAQIAKLQGALGKMRAALPQLGAASAKMAAGKAAMSAAKSKIRSALSQMADGIGQLDSASDAMRKAAAAQAAGVEVARHAVDETRLRAPADGTVVSALPGGQVAMIGAPVVVIRPAGPVLLDAFLSPDQASRVRVGDRADVTLDSVKGPVQGTVVERLDRCRVPAQQLPDADRAPRHRRARHGVAAGHGTAAGRPGRRGDPSRQVTVTVARHEAVRS